MLMFGEGMFSLRTFGIGDLDRRNQDPSQWICTDTQNVRLVESWLKERWWSNHRIELDCDMNELMSDSHMTAASLYYRSYIIATITHPHRGDDGHVWHRHKVIADWLKVFSLCLCLYQHDPTGHNSNISKHIRRFWYSYTYACVAGEEQALIRNVNWQYLQNSILNFSHCNKFL